MILTCKDEALSYLSAADPALGAAIARIGPVEREGFADLFPALVNSIAGQQISGKALETVWARLCAAVGELTPASLLAAGEESLRACGLSGRKVGYLRAAAEAFSTGTLDEKALRALPDEAFIRAMTVLPGVGRWTAEMLLIFCLQRPDVLAFDDFGIRKGLCLLHGLSTLTKEQFGEYRARYSPHGTVASFYLWAIANNG